MSFIQNTQRPKGLSGKIMVLMMNHGHSHMANWGLSKLKTEKEWNVLDIGCGGGANVRRLIRRCRHVTGVDYSEISVEKSMRVNRKAIDEGRCSIEAGNVSDLPFSENSFDLATAFETVYFWPQLEKSFEEVRRILRPGGHFFICNESDGSDALGYKWESIIQGMKIYKTSELEAALRKAGFRNIKAEGEPKKHWVCVEAQK